MQTPALQAERLSVVYQTEQGSLRAVRGVDLAIAPREALGLVGESGSGKTTLALATVGYVAAGGRIEAGSSRLQGTDLLSLPRRELRKVWGSRIGLVSQNPQAALNPTLTVGRQLDEMARLHLGLGQSAARRASLAMLERVGMPAAQEVAASYPHQLSGGMLQRCAIAMALLPRPSLLLLDEPTTSLDVTTQALILDLLDALRGDLDLAILYITHNLAVVSQFCDRVAVMYAGTIVEEAGVADLFSRPLHPYTANLLHCMPRLERTQNSQRLATIGGSVPRLDALPAGCSFAPRCPLSNEVCTVGPPPLVEVAAGHGSACVRWRLLESPEGRGAALLREVTGITPVYRAGRDLSETQTPMLEVDDVSRGFAQRGRRPAIQAVAGATLSIPHATTFGLVGESGSGKTTLARVISGLTPAGQGTVLLEGVLQEPAITNRRPDSLRLLQMVFQNADASLNPRRTVGQALERPLRLLAGLGGEEASQEARRLLEAVRLPADHADRYPGELSGGEKQRVAIARAFAARPGLIICDEPVSSLDVSVQGAIINLLIDLQEEAGTSYLFISHDVAAVQHLSHLIAVMYLGKLMEQGEAGRVLAPPYHPYTESLLSAVPLPDPGARRRRIRLREGVPSSAGVPSGCRFHPRCPRYLGEICDTVEPPWRLAGGTTTDSDAVAAETVHAICCHIAWQELAALQTEA